MAYHNNRSPAVGAAGLGQGYLSGKTEPRLNIKARTTTQAPVIGVIDNNNICRIGNHVTAGRKPVLTACRELLRQGVEPDRALEIYRRGILALRIRYIGEGARLTVREDRGPPEFDRYKALPLDAVRPRAAIEHRAGAIQPGQAEASP